MTCSGFAKVSLGLFLTFTPVFADELPSPPQPNPPVLGFFDASKTWCLARSYDAAHMAAHPKQKVTGIAFAYEPFQRFEGEPDAQPMWDQYASTGAIFAKIVVTMKDDPRAALGSADCRAAEDSETLRCGIEGDGGGFTLTRRPDGRYRIDNPQGFSVEYPAANPDEPNDGYRYVNPKDDQESFLLDASSGGLCDAQWN
jgi:hypothetical protein